MAAIQISWMAYMMTMKLTMTQLSPTVSFGVVSYISVIKSILTGRYLKPCTILKIITGKYMILNTTNSSAAR